MRAGLRTVRPSATTSISPVGRLGFSVPAGRRATVPATETTYSARRSPALAWAAGLMAGLKTTWVVP